MRHFEPPGPRRVDMRLPGATAPPVYQAQCPPTQVPPPAEAGQPATCSATETLRPGGQPAAPGVTAVAAVTAVGQPAAPGVTAPQTVIDNNLYHSMTDQQKVRLMSRRPALSRSTTMSKSWAWAADSVIGRVSLRSPVMAQRSSTATQGTGPSPLRVSGLCPLCDCKMRGL